MDLGNLNISSDDFWMNLTGDYYDPIAEESTEECYGASNEDLILYNQISYWVELVAQNIIASVGIVTNLIALPILCK